MPVAGGTTVAAVPRTVNTYGTRVGLPSLLAMDSVMDFTPLEVGENVTVNGAVAPAAKLVLLGWVTINSDVLPVMATTGVPDSVSVPPPVFEIVNVVAALELPGATVPRV